MGRANKPVLKETGEVAAAPDPDGTRSSRKVDYGAFKPLADAVQLRDIVPMHFSATTLGPVQHVSAAGFEQSISYKAQREEVDPSVLLSVVEFKYKAFQDGDAVMDVNGAFVVAYTLENFDIDEVQSDLVDLFCEANDIYNAWPYLRELVGDCASRLGLSGVVLPVWRPPTELPPPGEFLTIKASAPAPSELNEKHEVE